MALKRTRMREPYHDKHPARRDRRRAPRRGSRARAAHSTTMHAALTQSTTLAATAVAATRATTSKTTRRSLVIMNNSSGPKRGTKSAPAQRAVGYKGSTDAGSAPKTCVMRCDATRAYLDVISRAIWREDARLGVWRRLRGARRRKKWKRT